jgi:hypothetical protein
VRQTRSGLPYTDQSLLTLNMELYRMSLPVLYLLGLLIISLVSAVLSKSMWLTENAGDFSLNNF